MKVAVSCRSPLLQKSLELFLKEHLTSLKSADVVVTDSKLEHVERMQLRIGSDEAATLKKPFSKSQLYIALENLLESQKSTEAAKKIVLESESVQTERFGVLEKRIMMLTREYERNILETIRAFYEE